ncbi:MAG: ComEC/Rec2 family competence protein [Bacteroidota bacterium]
MRTFLGYRYSEIPVFFSLISFLTGFITLKVFSNISYLAYVLAAISLLIIISAYIRKLFFWSFIFVSFLFGIIYAFAVPSTRISNPYPIDLEFKAFCDGKIISVKNSDEKKVNFIFDGKVFIPDFKKKVEQRVFVKYYNPSFELYSGDRIKFSGKIRLPRKKVLPNEFDEEQYYAGQDIQWIAIAEKVSIVSKPINLYYYRDLVRQGIKSVSGKLFDNEQSSVINAILPGDKSSITPEIRQLYAYSGTAHVLALSGLHIGVISFVIYIFIGIFRNHHIKFVCFVLVLLLYNFITEFQPSAVRASLMAIMILYAKYYQRQYTLLNVASAVILFSIIFSPNLIYSISFQMSSLAILGISLFFNPINNFLKNILSDKRKILMYIRGSIAITFSASVVLSPLVAYYFKTFSLISFVANLFVVPIFSLVLISSLIAIIISLVSFSIASYYAYFTTFLLLLTNKINQLLISIPFSYISGETSLYYSLFLCFAIIYIFTSTSTRLIISRTIVCILMIPLLIYFSNPTFDSYTIKNKKIYPRNQLVASFFRYSSDTVFVYLADRKPAQYPKNDYYLVDYLSKIPDELIIAVNGNAGINTADILKETRNFKYIELAPSVQKELEAKLFPNTFVSQIIQVIDED